MSSLSKLNGYPIVPQYKYLGLHLEPKLIVDEHLSEINKKLNHIASKFYPLPLRRKANLKLSKNLFTTFISPLYRLAYALNG